MYCVLNRNICVSDKQIHTLLPVIKKYNIKINNIHDLKEVIQTLLKGLNLKREYEIWYDARVREVVGDRMADSILFEFYKPAGPRNTNDLLSNFNIEDIMNQWKIHDKALFRGKTFETLGCVCIDFNDYNNKLRNVTTKDILGYDAVACVLNTDVHTGAGKHWICFYIDNDAKEILFFNSSGNVAPIQLNMWFEKLILDLKIKHKLTYKKKNVVTDPIQKSNTECGVWCLTFIKSKLMGFKDTWIIEHVNDLPYMGNFRKHLFRDEV